MMNPDPGPAPHACLDAAGEAELRSLVGAAPRLRLSRGEHAVERESAFDGILLVLGGSLKLSRLAENGRAQTFGVVAAGECFCLCPVPSAPPCPFAVECVEPATVVRLGEAACRRLSAACPSFTAGVTRCLAQRMSGLVERMEAMATAPVSERLLGVLRDLGRRRGNPLGQGWLLERWTHEELAACIDSVREVVTRTLARLATEGKVELRGRSLLVRA